MKPFLMLRALVYLKRISKALERIADAQEVQTIPVPTPRIRKIEVFTPTVEQRNEMYVEEHPE